LVTEALKRIVTHYLMKLPAALMPKSQPIGRKLAEHSTQLSPRIAALSATLCIRLFSLFCASFDGRLQSTTSPALFCR
jgi:hypothetical protein